MTPINTDNLLLSIQKVERLNSNLVPMTGWFCDLMYELHANGHGDPLMFLTISFRKDGKFTYFIEGNNKLYTQHCDDFLPIYYALKSMEQMLDEEWEDPGIVDRTLTEWSKPDKQTEVESHDPPTM